MTYEDSEEVTVNYEDPEEVMVTCDDSEAVAALTQSLVLGICPRGK